MGKVIAVANQKGGVGKTTTSVNLAASLAAAEHPTLLLDFDPQANATSGLGIDARTSHPTAYELIIGEVAAEEAIVHTQMPFLDLIPSHINLIGAEIEMVDAAERERILKNALATARRRYDFIVIDCGPSLGLLTLNALTAADSVLIPVQAEYFALEGLGQLLNTIKIVRQHLNPELEIEGVLLTMFDTRLRLANQVADEVRRYFGDKVFRTIVQRNVRLSEAPSFGKPVLLYDAASLGSRHYISLAGEVIANNQRFLLPAETREASGAPPAAQRPAPPTPSQPAPAAPSPAAPSPVSTRPTASSLAASPATPPAVPPAASPRAATSGPGASSGGVATTLPARGFDAPVPSASVRTPEPPSAPARSASAQVAPSLAAPPQVAPSSVSAAPPVAPVGGGGSSSGASFGAPPPFAPLGPSSAAPSAPPSPGLPSTGVRSAPPAAPAPVSGTASGSASGPSVRILPASGFGAPPPVSGDGDATPPPAPPAGR